MDFCKHFDSLNRHEKKYVITEIVLVENVYIYILDTFMEIFSYLSKYDWKCADNVWEYCCTCLTGNLRASYKNIKDCQHFFDFVIKSAKNGLIYRNDLYLTKLFDYLKQLQKECHLDSCIIKFQGLFIRQLFINTQMIHYMCLLHTSFPNSLSLLFSFDNGLTQNKKNNNNSNSNNNCNTNGNTNYNSICLFFDNGIGRALKCQLNLNEHPNTMIDNKIYINNGATPIDILNKMRNESNDPFCVKLISQIYSLKSCDNQITSLHCCGNQQKPSV